MPTVAVTGASGGVGSRVVRSLLDLEHDLPVVALTRTPEAIPELPQLTARYANYDDPSSLRGSLREVDTLVFVSSDGVADPMRRHHEHVISAAVEAGVGHVVYTSTLDVSPDSASTTRRCPAALTATEICQITQTATGRALRYLPLDDPSYRALMARQRAPDWLIEAHSTMFQSVRAGRFERVSAGIPQLTGAPAQSYGGFIETTPPARSPR